MPDGLPPAALAKLAEAAAVYWNDPLGFDRWAFPWGQGELEDWPKADDWQETVLAEISERLKDYKEPIRVAVGAANGVGKSAIGARLLLWAATTNPFTRGTVTANTAHQLKTKTWAELGKWHRLCVAGPLIDLQATSLVQPAHPQTWRIDALPWNRDKPEATAGMHNEGRIVILWTDESSSVDDIIWEYQERSTTGERERVIWLVTGNTTRNRGRFKECWGRFDHRWVKPTGPGIRNGKVDGRNARATNKKLIQQWIEDYGEDSDFVRVAVRAEFPRIGDLQFFPSDWIFEARKRSTPDHEIAMVPANMSVDVAGTGSNKTVVTCRRGQRLMWQRSEQYTPDTMQLCGKLVDILRTEKHVASVAIDANGLGKGVADRMSELHLLQPEVVPPIIHVFGSHSSSDPIQFRNMRSELYSRCRDWLRQADIPYDSTELSEQLEAMQAGYNAAMQIEVETKKAYTDRTKNESPDEVDSLVYSFSEMSPTMAMRGRLQKRPLQQGRPL